MLPFVLSQTILKPEDLEVGTATVLFTQTLGGAIIFGLGQSLFLNAFKDKILAIPDLPNKDQIILGGITAFRVRLECCG